jgi:xylulokinase
MSKGELVLGIDLGTQRLKVMLMDLGSARIVSEAGASIPTFSTEPGAMEQDPLDWWELCCSLLNRLWAENSVSPEQVKAVGLSGEMHSLLLLDQKMKPVHPAILWADSRSAFYRGELQAAGVDLWNPPGAAYTALKLLWMRGKHPDEFARGRTLLFPKDYLRYKLTGMLGTDWSDASGSLVWDFRAKAWDEALIEKLRLEAIAFPRAEDPHAVSGFVTGRAAKVTGLKEGTPVVFGLGDVAAALVGAGAAQPDTVLINAGTAAQIIRVIDLPREAMRAGGERSAYLFELGVDDLRFAMGALPGAGFSLNWWRRILNEDLTYEEVDELAQASECGAAGCIYLPYLNGTGTPHLVDAPLGGYVGLSGFTNKAHMTRAVMEGVAFSIRQSLDTVDGRTSTIVVTGGITKSPVWTQILADVLGKPLQLREVKDASGIGACMVAARCLGAVDETASSAQLLGGKDLIKEPSPENAVVYERRFADFAHWSELFAKAGAGRAASADLMDSSRA